MWGLVPYRNTWTGGFKAVGKDIDSAIWVWEQTMRYEESGAIAVEMGGCASGHCSGDQSSDIDYGYFHGKRRGMRCPVFVCYRSSRINTGHIPRHAKSYRNFAAEYARLKTEAADAFAEFRSEVLSGSYPQDNHQVSVREDLLHEFLERIEARRRADTNATEGNS
jgi:3-methyl-2-oxobutanoate hydroxymethyltransferase